MKFSLQTGTTALFFAAQAGHIDVAKILFRYGAYIDAASLVSHGIDLFGFNDKTKKKIHRRNSITKILAKISKT